MEDVVGVVFFVGAILGEDFAAFGEDEDGILVDEADADDEGDEEEEDEAE